MSNAPPNHPNSGKGGRVLLIAHYSFLIEVLCGLSRNLLRKIAQQRGLYVLPLAQRPCAFLSLAAGLPFLSIFLFFVEIPRKRLRFFRRPQPDFLFYICWRSPFTATACSFTYAHLRDPRSNAPDRRRWKRSVLPRSFRAKTPDDSLTPAPPSPSSSPDAPGDHNLPTAQMRAESG